MKKLIAIFILTAANIAQAERGCGGNLRADATAKFNAYLSQLLEQRVIGEPELNALFDGIETRGEIVNPIPHTTVAQQIHFDEIENYIANARLNVSEIHDWVSGAIKDRQHVKVMREEVRVETASPFRKIIVHRLHKDESLDHEIEVMDAPVTQHQWIEIMGGKAPPSESSMQADNPVDNISSWSAFEFANRLSEVHGLRPVYKIEYSANGIPLKYTIEAPGEDLAMTEGFRLPTSAEMIYLMADRDVKWADHAWHLGNSGSVTHPVAQRAPVTIQDKPFYDVLGNVQVWAHTGEGHHLAMAGGSAWDSLREVEKKRFKGHDLEYGCKFLGLRLVRTVK